MSAAAGNTVGRHEVAATQFVAAGAAEVYRVLIDPAEQLRWNSLYVEASVSPPGPISSGSRLSGRFKGSGRAEVTFVDVVPGQRFTHHSVLRVPGTPVVIGSFDHTYIVATRGSGAEVTQRVQLGPTGLGRLLAPLIMASFRRRLPVSFDELRRFVEGQGT